MNGVVLRVFFLVTLFSLSGRAENRFEKLPKLEYLTFDLTECQNERLQRLASNHITLEEFNFLVSKGAASVHDLEGRPIGFSMCSK